MSSVDSPASNTEGALERADASAAAPRRMGVTPDSFRASCGDGIRQATEDCDEGLAASALTACSQRCKSRDLLVSAPLSGDAGAFARTLGAGRHPVAATTAGFAMAYVERTSIATRVMLRAFDVNGIASGTPVVLDGAAAMDADPSVAALPNGQYAVVWSDRAIDERDVALTIVDPATSTARAIVHANAVTVGSQYDADVVFANGQLVVAWTDTSDAANGPDVRVRAFDAATLAPATLDDVTLGATADPEGAASLTTFAGSWAAAWRRAGAGGETLNVVAGATSWALGPYIAGASGDRPALAALDARHLLAVYSEGVDTSDGGAPSSPRLRRAVLDVSASGSAPTVWLGASAVAQDAPSAVTVGATTFVAWRAAATTGDPLGEELWLAPLGWNGSALDASAAAISLPRWPSHRAGDQRAPSLAAASFASGALIAAWIDLGATAGAREGLGDVMFELAPVPIVRGAGAPDDPPCAVGRYCDATCTDVTGDPNNCGSCGVVCDPVANGVARCAAGTCVPSCASAFHSCGGACVSNASVATCGASCTACAAPPGAQATCDGVSCGFTCGAGTHACGGACASNGSVTTCGASCAPCVPPPGAQATCDGTSCGFTCGAGSHACGSACASNTSVASCGASCTACVPPAGAQATCNGASCGFTCGAGSHACGNACASNTSITSCGTSCTACVPPPGSLATCDGVSCGFTCGAGTHACGGACASNGSVATCGASCTPCATPANAAPTCNGAACGFTCNAGFVSCNGACVSGSDPRSNACAVTEQYGVFVSSSRGSAGGDGTRARPFFSLQAAISAAKAANKNVFACAETYAESLTVVVGVTSYGYFACAGGAWQVSTARAVVSSPTSPAMYASAIHATTRFESFEIVAPDTSVSSASSIGLVAIDAGGLVIVGSRIHGGRAGAGADGTPGSAVTQTATSDGDALGNGGASACVDASSTPLAAWLQGGAGGAGGAAGTREQVCGEARNGGCIWNITPPLGGSSGAGAAGGMGGAVGGGLATIGGVGSAGTSGAGGGAVGYFDNAQGRYIPANAGTNGFYGTPGSGGGGAAGIAATATRQGRVGAGGGAGGCTGVPGNGGNGGGASIGVLAFASTMSLENTTIESADGGAGGRGAPGSAGTAGGNGAAHGGAGGQGGSGGSGGGGMSLAYAHTGALATLVSCTLVNGAGGNGQSAIVVNGMTIAASANGTAAGDYGF